MTDRTEHWAPVTATYSKHRMTSTDQQKMAVAWIIDAARITPSGVSVLTVACPYCGGIHRHGSSDAEKDDPGHRVPHCAPMSLYGGYRLAWPTNTLADLLRAVHDICCAVTQAGARCSRPATVRNWLCPLHMDKLGRVLTVRFQYPTRQGLRLDALADHVVTPLTTA